jgi:pentatricopeptide repeat protein
MSDIVNTVTDSVSGIYIALQPVCVELSFLVCFALGFTFLRLDSLAKGGKQKKVKKVDDPTVKQFDPRLRKTIEAEGGCAGGAAAVLTAWRAGKDSAPTPSDLLSSVVQALVEAEPKALVQEIVDHVQAHRSSMADTKTAWVVLDTVARSGNVVAMAQIWKEFNTTFQVAPTSNVYEVLLGGYATVGDEAQVAQVFSQMKRNRIKPTARGMSLTIKGFLKNGMVQPVLRQIVQMQQQGFHVPTYAMQQFFRITAEASMVPEMFDAVLEAGLPLPPEALSLILENCSHKSNLELAKRVERIAKETKTPLLAHGYDALLKMWTVTGDIHAIELFEEMQQSGVRISEGLCVGLLARCAEIKFMRFAEDIFKHARSQNILSIAVYSALMKVYAYSNMYDKACNLYEQILADGIEPDAMMYGCLMKFAVECGRTDLSRTLAEKAPSLDIQNYMSLIRAAGRDGDVDTAFAVLEKLKQSGLELDNAAYNCALDVCACAGRLDRAKELIADMRANSTVDIITFNTLLKAYCNAGDLRGAKELLGEMQEAGLQPNDVTFNCLLNAAVSNSKNNFAEAWDTIDLMVKSGVQVDHFTISIMMKALKKGNNSRDVGRALSLLDKSGIDVCSDEILLNTVLETCIRHRETRRLQAIVSTYWKSDMRPSVHTYGALMKACSNLKKIDQCWELWREMEDQRKMEPNDIVLGCMLDALVTNGRQEDAVQLFRKWKVKVPANTVMWSTLIKGFASTHQAEAAMNAWREMRRDGVSMNSVVYNAIIDAQARVGNVDQVVELVETMPKDGCRPDQITHSTVAKGYCVKGELDKAFDIFKTMQTNNMANDSIIYNTMLDGCTRHSRWDLADQVLADMEKNQIAASTFTLGILVKMWGRRRNLDKAFEAVRELPRKHHFSANPQVLTCLMCTCINNNALDRAFEVFQELKSQQACDAKAYGSLISGCVRHGQLQWAQDLIEEAYGLKRCPALPRNAPLGPDSLEVFLRALAGRGMLESVGQPLLDKLRSTGIPVPSQVWSMALNLEDSRKDQRDNQRTSGKGGGHSWKR